MRINSTSSFIKWFEYDEEKRTLSVHMNNKTYVHSNVPQETFDDMSCAESHGKFYNESIRGKYETK